MTTVLNFSIFFVVLGTRNSGASGLITVTATNDNATTMSTAWVAKLISAALDLAWLEKKPFLRIGKPFLFKPIESQAVATAKV